MQSARDLSCGTSHGQTICTMRSFMIIKEHPFDRLAKSQSTIVTNSTKEATTTRKHPSNYTVCCTASMYCESEAQNQKAVTSWTVPPDRTTLHLNVRVPISPCPGLVLAHRTVSAFNPCFYCLVPTHDNHDSRSPHVPAPAFAAADQKEHSHKVPRPERSDCGFDDQCVLGLGDISSANVLSPSLFSPGTSPQDGPS